MDGDLMQVIRQHIPLKKEKPHMTDLSQNQRVLGRTGARELSQDELSLVHGSDCGRPTSTLSRDPNGVPRDITQE